VGGLTLSVSAGSQAADVRAYPAAGAWEPAQNGALEDAPPADLSRYCAGRMSVDGATLLFPDIGRLVTEQGQLSAVLIAGPADRVVVQQPGARALAVSAPSGPASTPPQQPAAAPPAAPVALPTAVLLPPAVPGLGEVLPPALSPAPSTIPVALPAPTLPAPTLPAPTVPVARRAAELVADDDRTRAFVLGEALLVLAFFGLLGQGPLAVLARATGSVEPAGSTGVRGVGRFRSARTGRVPRL
jgi:hypothetical protein